MLGRFNRDGGRSAEERAAAAEERARRRGTAPPPMHSIEPPPPIDDEPLPEPEPTYEAEPVEEPPPVSEPVEEPPPVAEPEPEPDPIQAPPPAPEPPPEDTGEHVWPRLSGQDIDGTPEPAALQPPPPPPPPPEPVVDLGPLTLPPRRPAPNTGRVPDNPRAAPPLGSRPPGQRTAKLRRHGPARARPPRPPRRARVSGGGAYTRRRILAGIVVLVVLAFLFLVNKTFQPFHGDPTGVVRVTIAEGSDVGSIGDQLAAREVISSPGFFSLNATLTGRRGDLQPGEYTLQRNMSYGAVLDALEKGPKAAPPPKMIKLTLPEGLSISELSARVKDAGLEGDYAKATHSRRAIARARELGLPKGQASTEGFLFPATYDLVAGGPVDNLVAQQMNAYADNIAGIDYRFAKRKNLTPYDVLIIASMVEREAQLDEERPKVASVIYNRLKAGMVLGIDATIRYAENNWDKPLLQSELDRPGPYNSRLNRDLPPTPIGNPGLASLQAAARPAQTGFLYYVVKPCGNGSHVFSKTDAEAAQAVAEYNAAREQAGGKSPANC